MTSIDISLLVVLLFTAFLSSNGQTSEFQSIAGYFPATLVTDENAIDLDQEAMEVQLALGTTESIATAKAIYEQGAFSKSYAAITIPSPIPLALPKGSVLSGFSNDGTFISGIALEDHPAQSTVIKFQYVVEAIQASYSTCQVGALPLDEQTRDGCLKNEGGLRTEFLGSNIPYSYDQERDNYNDRSLQRFSTTAQSNLLICQNCPKEDFVKFYRYYGDTDYADKWIQAAFAGTSTEFRNGLGNADFSTYDQAGRLAAIKKAPVYLNTFMEIIYQMEDALDKCEAGCTDADCADDAVNAWDQAVAFYTGSLEGSGGSGYGKLLYTLADKRCRDFRTCGEDGDTYKGTSQVNLKIFNDFRAGKLDLNGNTLCSAARTRKERILGLMVIPLIQGTLRLAYIKDKQRSIAAQKDEAEGAVYAAALLPLVHDCSNSDAELIWENMAVGSGPADFVEVKGAFERNYDCLGIDGRMVGGLYDPATNVYYEDAEPCCYGGGVDEEAAIVGGVMGVFCFILILIILYLLFTRRNASRKDPDFTSGETNGAVTSEIAMQPIGDGQDKATEKNKASEEDRVADIEVL